MYNVRVWKCFRKCFVKIGTFSVVAQNVHFFHALCSTMREGDPLTFEGQRDHPVTTLKTDDETPNAEWNDVEIVAIDPVNTEL